MPDIPIVSELSTILIVAVLILLSIFIFRKSMRLIFRFILNTIGGFITLFAIDWIGAFFGFGIGLNFVNAVIVGIFGLPGVGFLLIFPWLMSM